MLAAGGPYLRLRSIELKLEKGWDKSLVDNDPWTGYVGGGNDDGSHVFVIDGFKPGSAVSVTPT